MKFDATHDFSNLDHIVSGYGIGELAVAKWLAKSGKKVLRFKLKGMF